MGDSTIFTQYDRLTQSKLRYRHSLLQFFVNAVGCALLTTLMVFTFLYGLDQKNKKNEERAAWPSIQGTVVSSKASIIRGEHLPDRVKLKVEFNYVVNGQSYSDKQSWEEACDLCGKKTAEKRRLKYSPGRPVTVYYNPADTSDGLVNTKGGFLDSWLSAAAYLAMAFVVLPALGMLYYTGSFFKELWGRVKQGNSVL